MQQLTAGGNLIEIIHFVSRVMAPPTEGSPEGPPTEQWRIACMPNMTEFHQTPYHPHYQRTDDVRAVSCPACMKTTVFKESKRILGEMLGRTLGA